MGQSNSNRGIWAMKRSKFSEERIDLLHMSNEPAFDQGIPDKWRSEWYTASLVS